MIHFLTSPRIPWYWIYNLLLMIFPVKHFIIDPFGPHLAFRTQLCYDAPSGPQTEKSKSKRNNFNQVDIRCARMSPQQNPELTAEQQSSR